MPLVDYSSSSEEEDGGKEEAIPPAAAAAAALAFIALPPPKQGLKKRRRLPLLDDVGKKKLHEEEDDDEIISVSSSEGEQEEIAALKNNIKEQLHVVDLDNKNNHDDDDDYTFSIGTAAPALAPNIHAVAHPTIAPPPAPAAAAAHSTRPRKPINEHAVRVAVESGKDVSAELGEAAIELSHDFLRGEAAKYRVEDALKAGKDTAFSQLPRGDGRNHISSLVQKAKAVRGEDVW
jgi:hypothetical protein